MPDFSFPINLTCIVPFLISLSGADPLLRVSVPLSLISGRLGCCFETITISLFQSATRHHVIIYIEYVSRRRASAAQTAENVYAAVIERSQNVECITVCCVWDCVAADRSGSPF